jgi:ankyrin repeat protein
MNISPASARATPSPPNAPVTLWLSNLRRAINPGNEQGVWQQLHRNGSNIQSDGLHGLLKQACRKQCSPAFKMMLAGHPNTDKQGALDLALKHDDYRFAEQLLAKNPDLKTGHLQPRSRSMHAALQFARRNAILYPGAAQSNETTLDQALRNGHKDEARELLNHELRKYPKGADVSDVWGDAVRNDRVDLQRALLLLGYVDSQVRYRLKEDDIAAITDPGVKKVMKEIPYYSPKRGEPKRFNGVAGPSCRHFVLDQLREKALKTNPDAKSNLENYQDQKKVKDNVSTDNKEFIHLKAHATESHLIDNRKFGQFLVQQFEAMEGKGASTKLMLMQSTNHAMELSLRIKEKEDGTKVYVVKFFDPNLTTTHARSASTDLQAFAFQNLRDYLDEAERVELYYPESEGISMLHVYPGPDELQAMASLPPGAVAGRKATTCIPDEKINATAIWHLMSDGFAEDLRRLKDEIAGRPEAKRITLLDAKNAHGTSALFMALQNGHADAVEAYGELLSLIPKEQHAEVLDATVMFLGKGGATAVMHAAANGLAKPLQFLIDYGAKIDLADKNGKTAVMHATKKNQIPALRVLIDNGADIDAKDKNGQTAVMHAIVNGHTDVLQFLIDNGADINAKDKNGKTAVMHAARKNKIPALQFLIDKGADIDATDKDGKTAAMHAVANGQTDVLQFLIGKGARSIESSIS